MIGRCSPGGTAARTEATGRLRRWLCRAPCETLIPCRSQPPTTPHAGMLPDEVASVGDGCAGTGQPGHEAGRRGPRPGRAHDLLARVGTHAGERVHRPRHSAGGEGGRRTGGCLAASYSAPARRCWCRVRSRPWARRCGHRPCPTPSASGPRPGPSPRLLRGRRRPPEPNRLPLPNRFPAPRLLPLPSRRSRSLPSEASRNRAPDPPAAGSQAVLAEPAREPAGPAHRA